MGANYSMDWGYKMNNGSSNWETSNYGAYNSVKENTSVAYGYPQQNTSHNQIYQPYGNYEEYMPRRCIVCERGENTSVAYGYPQQNTSHNQIYQPYGNYDEYMPRRCIVCKRGENEYGVRFASDPVWGQSYCYVHRNDWKTVRCCSCRRFKEDDHAEYIELGDGRKLCSYCLDSSIKSEEELKPLIDGMHKFFKNKNLKVEKSTPVFLVSKDEMLKILTVGDNREGDPTVDPFNLSTISEGVTIKGGKLDISNVIRCSQSGSSMYVTKGFKTISRKNSSIFIMYGLPRVNTGRILAHEMMHVWFNSQGLTRKVSPVVDEGLCEVMAKMWVEEQCNDLSTRLKDFVIFTIENSNRADAYRLAEAAVKKYGLASTLKFVSDNKKLPV